MATGGDASSPAAIELDRETEDCLLLGACADDEEESLRRPWGAPSDEGYERGDGGRLGGGSAFRGRRFRRGEELDGDSWDSDGDEDFFPVGSRVRHDAYGDGEVVRVSGFGGRRRVTVAFDDNGEKQFVLGIAPLKRIR